MFSRKRLSHKRLELKNEMRVKKVVKYRAWHCDLQSPDVLISRRLHRLPSRIFFLIKEQPNDCYNYRASWLFSKSCKSDAIITLLLPELVSLCDVNSKNGITRQVARSAPIIVTDESHRTHDNIRGLIRCSLLLNYNVRCWFQCSSWFVHHCYRDLSMTAPQ